MEPIPALPLGVASGVIAPRHKRRHIAGEESQPAATVPVGGSDDESASDKEIGELTEEERRTKQIAEWSAHAAADRVAKKILGKVEKKVMKAVDERLEQMTMRFTESHRLIEERFSGRLEALEKELHSARGTGSAVSAVSSSPGLRAVEPLDPWADYRNRKGSGKGSATRLAQPTVEEEFPRKVEVKGFVKDWDNWKSESLSRTEASAWLKRLFATLSSEKLAMINKDATLAANSKPHVPILNICVLAGQTFQVKKFLASAIKAKELWIRGVCCKVAVEPKTWQKPLRKAAARIFSSLQKIKSFEDGSLTSSYAGQKLSIHVGD